MVVSSGMNIYDLAHLRNKTRVFRGRVHAGEVLADMIKPRVFDDAIVFGIPAGGVPVGAAIANKLGMLFDVAVVSKITLPWNTEAGYGAVAFDGTVRLNKGLMARLNLADEGIEDGMKKTMAKVQRRVEMLRGDRPFPDLRNRSSILVDDGLASGFTMLTAIAALRNVGAEDLTVAVPTGHTNSVNRLAPVAERLFCANIRSGWSFAVADAYQRWYDLDETEILEILRKTTKGGPP